METPQYLDIVIFAMIAVFLGLRLRNILGRRNPDQPSSGLSDQRGAVVDFPGVRRAPEVLPSDPLAAGLMQIGNADQAFDPNRFLDGAGRAFEIIVRAFAAGDMATLRPLLSDQVFADFAGAVEARAKDTEDHRMELVRLVSAGFAEAGLDGRTAEIAVRFVSEQRAADGTQSRLIDLWRFARDTGARDPNWRLVATGSLDS